MLKLLNLTIPFLVLFSQLVSAQTIGAPGNQLLEHPFYFKITPQQKSGPVSYILGTLHGGVDIKDLPTYILQDFKNSQALIVEWRFTVQEIKSVQTGQILKEKIKNFKHEGEDLTAEEKADLKDRWGIDKRLADKAKSQDCALLVFGGEFENGYLDFDLLEAGIKARKKITALDTQSYYDSLKAKVEKLPACDIRPILKYYDPKVLKESQLEMIKQYRAGNADALTAEGMSEINQGRNQNWMPVLAQALRQQNSFVAVGAAHLFGEGGLLELLKSQGFDVEAR